VFLYLIYYFYCFFEAEKLNGRFAMLGLLGTTLLEVLNGHPVLPMLGIR